MTDLANEQHDGPPAAPPLMDKSTSTDPGVGTGARSRQRARFKPEGRTRLWVWGTVCALLVLTALAGPWLVGDTEASHLGSRLYDPGEHGHLLGTDGQGRDVLARVVAGARPSLVAGITPVLIAAVIGSTLGIAAGLAGQRVGTTVMRALDVVYAFPAVLLAVAISASLGSGVVNAIIALSIVLIPPVARVVETETLRIRSADFMTSARASGAGWAAIAVRQVLPVVLPVIVVYCTALAGMALVFAAGLSFLGLGVAPPHAEWGLMVADLRPYIYANPALSLLPAAALLLASTAFLALGDALRTRMDVRQEALA
ncbi:ABC transporter permease [Streptomyces sp. NBC_01643]|uniref:ABC transporter permease n=1 Tax=Streptomyces sp. NBC_01643 TaxID=2975906 RepID=UPI002F91474D|nr:ABC transporter permease [Streptomyces sp. NBC_01643]